MRQGSSRLLDDFRTGGVVVRAPVAVVVVLVRIKIRVRAFGVEAAGFSNRAVGTLKRAGEDKLCTERAQDELTFLTGVLRHAQFDLVSSGCSDHRVSDAGITRRRVEDRLLWRERARLLTFGNHPGSGAIFHRATGILPLGLRIDLDTGACLLDLAKPNQRSAADEVEDGGADVRRLGSGCH